MARGPVVLVCGSRDWPFEKAIHDYLKRTVPELVVHGDAPRGADRMARRQCSELGIHQAPIEALWDFHGRSAGHIRNHTMALLAPALDAVVAFWVGESPGTAGMIRAAEAAGVPVEVVRP